jgi:hypothetical protein
MPEDFEAILHTAMDSDLRERYTASELAADLRRLAIHEPIERHCETLVQATSLWCRKNSVAARLAFSVVTVLVIALWVVTGKWREAEAQKAELVELRNDAITQREKAMLAKEEAVQAALARVDTTGIRVNEKAPRSIPAQPTADRRATSR